MPDDQKKAEPECESDSEKNSCTSGITIKIGGIHSNLQEIQQHCDSINANLDSLIEKLDSMIATTRQRNQIHNEHNGGSRKNYDNFLYRFVLLSIWGAAIITDIVLILQAMK